MKKRKGKGKRIWVRRGYSVIEARLKSQWSFATSADRAWTPYFLVPTQEASKIIEIANAHLTDFPDALEYRLQLPDAP